MKRPRKFAATEQTARDADNSLWTETPAERQQRSADEVAGKRRRADKGAMDPEAEREMRKKRRYDEEVRRGVEEHTVSIGYHGVYAQTLPDVGLAEESPWWNVD